MNEVSPREEAQRLLQEGRWQEAVKVDPTFTEALGYLGWFYLETGKYIQAERIYKKYLEEEPNDSEAEVCLALACARQGKMNDACRFYKAGMKRLKRQKPDASRFLAQRWGSITRESRTERLIFFMKTLCCRSRIFRFLNRCRKILSFKFSNAVLCFYEPIARKHILPKFCLNKRHFCFSVRRYVNFIARYVCCKSWASVTYARLAEVAVITETLDMKKGASVVDVGTGVNPLPLYWVRQGMRVVCTDPDDFITTLRPTAKRMGLSDALADKRLEIVVADGTELPFPDNSFDFWTSVSVIEHIPENGDMALMREAKRVLKPGGYAVLTTEGGHAEECWARAGGYFGKQYMDEIDPEELSELGFDNSIATLEAYEKEKGAQETFAFLRPYNRAKAMARLVEPSGLELIELGFLDSRFKKDLRWLLDSPDRPGWAVLLAPFIPLICYWSYRRLEQTKEDSLTEASTAYIILRKKV